MPATDPKDYISKLISQKGTEKIRVYLMADGTTETRTGGSASWRHNNPGNMKFEYKDSADTTVTTSRTKIAALSRAQALYSGVIDLDLFGNVIFNCYESGRTAKIQLLKKHSSKTVPQLLNMYSVDDYSGQTNHANQEESIYKTGDSQNVELRNKTIGQMSETELNALADGIKKFEGWSKGTVTRTGTNVAVNVVDRSHNPVKNLEYEIRHNGDVIHKGHTDHEGNMQPVTNRTSEDKISIHVKKDDGVLHDIGEFILSKFDNLITLVAPLKVETKTKKHNGDPQPTEPTFYPVQKGDSLSSIAKAHHASVKYLAAINKITDINHIKEGTKLKLPQASHTEGITKKESRNKDGHPITKVQIYKAVPPSGSTQRLIVIMKNNTRYNAKSKGFNKFKAIELSRQNLKITEATKLPDKSIGLCYTYVKIGLAAAGHVPVYLAGGAAKDAGPQLKKYGYKNIFNEKHIDKKTLPIGAVIVYKGGDYGHIEVWSGNEFISDYKSSKARTQTKVEDIIPIAGKKRGVIGIWVK